MILSPQRLQIVEPVDRRILGAVQLRDAATGQPIGRRVNVRATGAVLKRQAGDVQVPLGDGGVRIQQNRSGHHVLYKAPFFEDYCAEFLNPQLPPETQEGDLQLRLAIDDVGPHYLPQESNFLIPRSTGPNVANNVFAPMPITLFRSPTAPAQAGWSLLRISVVQIDLDPPLPLPGVLIRVFRHPRLATDSPIGVGMSDWRGMALGEALVPTTGVQRFRPGVGNQVVESDLPVVLEAIRATSFIGATGQLPQPAQLLAAIPADLSSPPATGFRLHRTTQPERIRAGHEESLLLELP